MLNRVILIGRLTRDGDLRYTASGTPTFNCTLAVDRPFKTNGEREADFINIVAWRKLAEVAANFLRKGNLCAIEGRLQARSYEANDGTRKYVTEVVADNIRFLESPNNASNERGNINTPSGNKNVTGGHSGGHDPFQDDGQPLDIRDDDLPF